MTTEQIFYRLFHGGGFSLPYLIKFYHPTAGSLCFVNSDSDIEFNDETYSACGFDYEEPDYTGDGGKLKITLVHTTLSNIKNPLIDLIDSADDELEIQVNGVLLEDGSINEMYYRCHKHFSVSYSTDMQLEVSFSKDDRLEMSFPPYVFDSDNNRGNN